MAHLIGDPNCNKCKGEGFIYGASMLTGGSTCKCMEPFLRTQNLKKTWPSLEKVKLSDSIKRIPVEFAERNVWVTASRKVFRQYLKKLILEMPLSWFCKVRTDAELLDSWFGTAKAQGTKIFDMEIDKSTLQAIDIRDLVEPYDLTIIWMGVKQLPNKEAPSSLLEALNYRNHLSKPTWIVDQPDTKLDASHKYYSEDLAYIMSSWPHLCLKEDKISKLKNVKRTKPSRLEPEKEEASNKYIDRWTDFEKKPKKKWKK